MRTSVKRVREDQYSFAFEDDGPVVEAGWQEKRYSAQVVHVYARFTPEGDLLSAKVTAKKIKKDGTVSSVNAHLPWDYHGLDDSVVGWRIDFT